LGANRLSDDGIRGAEGFLRLMNALKPRSPFQALVMSEESRLGRESIEVAYALKQLAQAGVRVWLYLEDRERTLDSPTEKLLMSVSAFADEMEREKGPATHLRRHAAEGEGPPGHRPPGVRLRQTGRCSIRCPAPMAVGADFTSSRW
jgi:DNA invertase Pin-like site-specific DNA recombinase